MHRCSLLSLVVASLLVVQPALASFICKEPGGKRLIQIEGNAVSKPDGKTLITIDGNELRQGDASGKVILVVDDDDVRPATAGVIIAHFDGSEIRHGPHADGKVLMDYRFPDLSPSHSAPRIYSVEGEQLNRQQLVAGLYLLQPELFKLSDDEVKAQQAAMREAGAEADRLAAADQVAGEWRVMSGHGPVAKIDGGKIVVGAKLGEAYPVTFDHSASGGPTWTGVGVYREFQGDRLFWTAYGTPKTVGLCVYEIKPDGTLNGTWYPWYQDGTPKNLGREVLKGPASLDGEFTIVSAAAPSTGAAYAGKVMIKPLDITGAGDWAKPYAITWDLAGYKLSGIGLRAGNFLYVSSGAGAEVNVARGVIRNGTMNLDWVKLGANQLGGAAAIKD